MKIIKKIQALAIAAVLVAGLASCSETSGTPEEFPDWKNTNEAYIDKAYAEAKALADGGDGAWKVLPSWSLEADKATHSYDHVLVNVLNAGTGSGCPLYTDSVKVHYRGHLLPTASYSAGYVFDQSWTGDYQPATMVPVKFRVGDLVNGFTTALMQMHIGDRWMVTLPYQLGYGTTSSSSIPAYSTLFFDVTLVAYYRANSTTKYVRGKDGRVRTVTEKRGEWIYE